MSTADISAIRLNLRQFGNTDFAVSELGMGCAEIGGGLYGVDKQESLRLLRMAFEHGINFFDTAVDYSNGDSERVLGRAFVKEREQVIFATKVGAVFTPIWESAARLKRYFAPLKPLIKPFHRQANLLRFSQKNFDFSADNIRAQLESSLRRLNTDYVDVLQLDRPDIGVLKSGELVDLLEQLKAAGKIRSFGVACRTIDSATAALEIPGIASIQVPVNMIDSQAYVPVIRKAAEQDVAVIAREPLAQGLLTDTTETTLAERSALLTVGQIRERKQLSSKLKKLALDNFSIAQTAIRFSLQQFGVTTVIPGMCNCIQFEENFRALAAPPISDKHFSLINEHNPNL